MKKGEIVERIDGGWSCQRRGCTSGIAYKWNRGPVSYGDYSLDMNTRYYILAFMYMGSTNKVSIQGLGSIRECIYKCLSPFGTVSKILADLAVLSMAREDFNLPRVFAGIGP